uniref:hypothetical protein n=1 Tax=Acetatifactor sp. TaxID=1872090 RepID=UPI00405731E0
MKRNVMRKGRNIVSFMIVTVCLVLVSAFCITGTVISQSNLEERELENFYREQEKELVQEIRDYLNQSGFHNSGVTMTKVIDTDGSRQYTITVHHTKINNMDVVSRENLKEELAALVFLADNCSFCHEFLVTD